jgi:hypothetical protein
MGIMRVPVVLISLMILAGAARAQCPDGTPPPCGDARPRPADPNRMVILPFRVSTTDTLLGEGFAELLAAEFTHDGMPKAVDMATVLGSWRAAGGQLRAPLTRERATRLARSLGAGVVSEGSIVGLGRQITITVALVNVTTGEPRMAPLRITGSADSLDVALRRTISALMGALAPGGLALTPQGGRYTASPEAMQSYLEGLALWRRGRNNDAALSFDRAIALDSTFGAAVFRRALAASWEVPGPQPQMYDALQWKLRDRLASSERIIVEAILGTDYPKPRGAPERTRDLDRAVTLLPESPDVLYYAGDEWYHFGGFVDPAAQWPRAKSLFLRSVAIDSQPLVIGHLIELGIHTFDTALVRAALRASGARQDSSLFARRWMGASFVGDAATLLALRRGRMVTTSVTPGSGLPWFADVPAPLLDEFYEQWAGMIAPARLAALRRTQASVLLSRGRAEAAMRVREAQTAAPRATFDADLLTLAVAGAPLGNLRLDDLGRSAAQAQLLNPVQRCGVLIWKGGKVETSSDSAAVRADPQCEWAREVLSIPADGSSSTLDRIARADSVLGLMFTRPYDPYLLARAWEANGKPAWALRAIRMRVASSGGGAAYHAWTLAYEGRLAAATGDTAGAVYAYRKWLGMMRDAEPAFAGLRDSVRAEVARLTRKP